MNPRLGKTAQNLAAAVIGFSLLYYSTLIFLNGYPLIGMSLLAIAVLLTLVYTWSRAYTWRYLFPGLVGFGMFVLLPLAYTIYISFTNYSSINLLPYERVLQYFEEETYLEADVRFPFTVHPVGDDRFEFRLREASTGNLYASAPINLRPTEDPHPLQRIAADAPEPAPALALREIVQLRSQIRDISFQLPEDVKIDLPEDMEDTLEAEERAYPAGIVLNNTGLREFGPRLPLWWHSTYQGTDRFTNARTGEIIEPNFATGFFEFVGSEDESGQRRNIPPGFRAWVGMDNYVSIATDPGLREPFIKIFIWTVLFALGSVFFSLCVGMFLAVLLEWKELHLRKVYRTLLILPYAVPAFISILIFRGLFNQNFGEINMILNSLFGIQPEWFADPTLAKMMIFMVNTWLGFPYMMIVCTGILQSVPDTIYEASSLDGSNAVTDFFFLTLPLIFKPLFPLLVASFAFNFNNFLIIYLLTGGGPDRVGSTTVAGETDILVSYTFRIAFRDSAQMFGYASAIATIIFIIVALIAWYNLRLTQKNT